MREGFSSEVEKCLCRTYYQSQDSTPGYTSDIEFPRANAGTVRREETSNILAFLLLHYHRRPVLLPLLKSGYCAPLSDLFSFFLSLFLSLSWGIQSASAGSCTGMACCISIYSTNFVWTFSEKFRQARQRNSFINGR